MKHEYKKIGLSIIALIAAAISPNLFVVSQAGFGELSSLAVNFLIPSIIIMILLIIISYYMEVRDLSRQIGIGLAAGMISTVGLEIVREIGFHLGGMPGDMPKLLGVLLLNQFAQGPDALSNIAGWSYHFWNGASFGIIYSILFGRGRKGAGIIYALLIGIGFMASPAVIPLGVGHFGVDFGIGFPVTVLLAHLAFGTLLGWLVFKWNKKGLSLFSAIKNIIKYSNENEPE
ncbi:MAG: hypothetical protein P8Z35_12105 [Ignavibacteriaceae bacterium]